MNGISSPQRDVRWESPDQRCCSSQQCVGDGYQIPNIRFDMTSEGVHQFVSVGNSEISLPNVAVKHAGDFDERPRGGTNVRCAANYFPHRRRVWLIHVIFRDIRGIKIHPQRSSSRKRPLSPATDGKRLQRSLRSGSLGLAGFFERGRSSATVSPRRWIKITVPSAASRTSSDVRIWRSRIEAVLMCYMVAPSRCDYKVARPMSMRPRM